MIPGLDLWQTILLGILILLCINYLCIVLWERMSMVKPIPSESEGFETMSQASRSETLIDEEIYDDFYASVYNKIFQHDKLLQAEAALVLHDWTKTTKPEDMTILDLCCGTGVATCYFAKENVGKIIAVDRSASMIRYAKKDIVPKTTLTDKQLGAIEWKEDNAYGPGIIQPASITHACMFYFTPYHFRDIDAIIRNLALWVKPGGQLAIEVVNKYKFEPIPDVANPWVAVSPQKYSKDRITKAKASFDKFEYESEFELIDPKAEFKETFRFKDGSVRNQKHILWMPSITLLIEKASHAGWRYLRYDNLDMIGFQYGYMLYFSRMP
jgi:ubiquinone/menaquinone biosynthesis C-methylase UbiE